MRRGNSTVISECDPFRREPLSSSGWCLGWPPLSIHNPPPREGVRIVLSCLLDRFSDSPGFAWFTINLSRNVTVGDNGATADVGNNCLGLPAL
ncbi:MAG: hypothetical protein OXD33_00705 [Rhodobacteraceae bacterium]|nr:hypothetical protein [Paracoccaceae bacterium]